MAGVLFDRRWRKVRQPEECCTAATERERRIGAYGGVQGLLGLETRVTEVLRCLAVFAIDLQTMEDSGHLWKDPESAAWSVKVTSVIGWLRVTTSRRIRQGSHFHRPLFVPS